MFPQGAYTNGTVTSTPAVYNSHGELILNTLNITSTNYFYSDQADLNYWIKHWSNMAMLFTVQHYLNREKMYFEHKRVSLSSANIERWKTTGLAPIDFGITRRDPTDYAISVKIIHIKQGVDTFRILEKTEGELKPVSLGLQQDRNHKIRVYKDTFTPNTLTIVTNLYNWELTQQIIAILPQLFQIEIPENLKGMFLAFGVHQYEHWFKLWSEWLTSLNLLEEIKNKAIANFLNKTKNATQTNLNRRITSCKQAIAYSEKDLIIHYKELDTAQTNLRHYLADPDIDANTLINFLKSNKAIRNITAIDSDKLILEIQSPIAYYDVELLKSYYKNSNSIITSKNKLAAVFDEIFLKQNYTMITECNAYISLESDRIRRASKDNYLTHELFKQPHIVEYDCWGQNGNYITKALIAGDHISAISQAIAATQNLNFGDTTVLSYFVEYINRHWDLKSIQDNETKEMVSCKQIWDLINPEREKRTNENNQTNASTTTVSVGEIRTVLTDGTITG